MFKFSPVTKNIWFTSDQHFGHGNIIKYCRRPFRDVTTMDNTIIHNFNRHVRHSDLVYHLGDFAWTKREEYLQQLNGIHYLIQGNHDFQLVGKQTGFVWVRQVELIEIDGQAVWLSHYPHYAWPQAHTKRTWHLYGHIHNNAKPYLGLAMNVGVDANAFNPVNWSYIHRKLTAMEKAFPPLSDSRIFNAKTK